jgi:hypothetical protein
MKRLAGMGLGAIGSALLGLWLALQYATPLLDRYVCPPPDGPNLCLLAGTIAAVVGTPIVFAAVATLVVALWPS